jgi:hypothetical protein
MRRDFGLLVLMGLLVATVAGCGATPEPSVPPPTQTPWIVVMTATTRPESEPQVQPTQTPWVVVATPTQIRQATPKPTEAATARPGATVEPTDTPRAPVPTDTSAPEGPTNTPEPGALKYPSPVLLDPPPNRPVSWRSTVLLQWTSVGELAADEYYHVHLERPPKTAAEQWYGDYVYTKEVSYLAEGAFLAPFHLPEEQGPAVVYWWVRVVRKTGEDETGKPIGIDISLPSQKWTLILDPKPAGQ